MASLSVVCVGSLAVISNAKTALVLSCSARSACVSEHIHQPFHRVQVRNRLLRGITRAKRKSQMWNDLFWERTSLRLLGLRIHLSHNGVPCSSPHNWTQPIIVFYTNSMHQVSVSFCECSKPEGGYLFGIQLLRASLFPTTIAQPRTAFTFEVLESFHHLTLQGKTTAWDSYNAILHTTDNTGLNAPPVCSCLSDSKHH